MCSRALVGCISGDDPRALRATSSSPAPKPDRLFIIDAATRKVRAEHQIAGANGLVSVILVSPDQRTAYFLVDRMERVVGIDLASGREVFRADLSTPDERVKSFLSLAVTPDGKELVVYELPTKLHASEYVVEEPRFAMFRTNAGLAAKPVRSFPAPRRVHMLLMRPNGKSFYAVGFDLDEYDVKTGKLLGHARHSKMDVARSLATRSAGVLAGDRTHRRVDQPRLLGPQEGRRVGRRRPP